MIGENRYNAIVCKCQEAGIWVSGLLHFQELWLELEWPHSLIDFNTWSSVSEDAWEGLRAVILLEDVCHWEWALRF